MIHSRKTNLWYVPALVLALILATGLLVFKLARSFVPVSAGSNTSLVEMAETFKDPAINLPRTGVFKDEIFQVALDGSGRVRRICHTRDAIDQKTDTTGYWAMPKPTISKDGRFIAFTSNWENSSRFDVSIARITPAPVLTKSR